MGDYLGGVLVGWSAGATVAALGGLMRAFVAWLFREVRYKRDVAARLDRYCTWSR